MSQVKLRDGRIVPVEDVCSYCGGPHPSGPRNAAEHECYYFIVAAGDHIGTGSTRRAALADLKRMVR